MTRIGFAFHFWSKRKQKKKSTTRIQLVEPKWIDPSGQKAEIRIEIPAEAIKATKENVALNPVAKDINIGTNSLLDGISKKVDLIVANILAEIIVPLIPQAKECLNPGGKFITSGIINDKKDLIVNELTAHGFVIDEILNQKDWYSIIAHLPSEGE